MENEKKGCIFAEQEDVFLVVVILEGLCRIISYQSLWYLENLEQT